MAGIVFYILIVLSFIGCSSIPKHLISDYGIYSHQDHGKLRINGYYYKLDSVNFGDDIYRPAISWIVLYRNGTLLQSFQTVSPYYGFEKFEAEVFNNPTSAYDYNNRNKNSIWWGAYSVEDGLINFQYFTYYGEYSAIERNGVIVNDSTIKITSFTNLSRDPFIKQSADFGIFRFKHFSNKPDSLNWMMDDEYYQKKIEDSKRNHR